MFLDISHNLSVSQYSVCITTIVSMQLNKRSWHTSHSSPEMKQSIEFISCSSMNCISKCQLFQISAPEVGPVTNINRNWLLPPLTKLVQFSKNLQGGEEGVISETIFRWARIGLVRRLCNLFHDCIYDILWGIYTKYIKITIKIGKKTKRQKGKKAFWRSKAS